MKRIIIIATFCASMTFLPVWNTAAAESYSIDDSVARIGNQNLTAQEFNDVLIRLRKLDDMKKVLETFTPEGKEKILNKLIEKRLFAMEATDRNLDKETKIKQAIQDAVNTVLAKNLRQKEINKLDLSDRGLKIFFDENQKLFMTMRRAKARHIITSIREQAEEALSEVKSGRKLSEVAEERNIDSTKSKGGDLGWVVMGIMVKPFEDALFSLEEGQVSDIVKTSFGFHIIKVEKIDKAKLKPFDIVKDKVKKQIIDQHISQLKENLREKYPVKINRELLLK